MKRCILKIFTLLVFSSLILSCSGGEKDSGLQEEYQKVDYTLGESSKVVKPEDAAGIVGVDEEGTIVFEADSALASSLKQNDVLLIGLGPKTPEGLLRRVNEIAEDKGQVVVKTSQASMEEAFSNLELSMFKNLQPAEVKQYSSSVEGLSFIQAPLTGEAGYEFKTGFDNTVLYDLDKNLSTKHDQVVANGNLSFFAGLKVDIEIDWFSLKRFSAGILIKQEGELEISSGIGVSLSKEIKVAEFYFAPMAVGPVVITPTIEIVVGIDGELSAKMVARVSQSVKADAGIVWESSKWGKYGSADWDFTYLPPSAEIEASVKGYAGVNLTTKIYGVAGPFGGVNGYLKYIVTPINTPWWRLYAGIEGKIGAKVEFLSFKLTEFSIKVYEGNEKLLAQAEDSPPPDVIEPSDVIDIEEIIDIEEMVDHYEQYDTGLQEIGEMVFIKGGCYMMGCVPGDGKCWNDEKPSHQVCVDDFSMGKTEVTVGQFEECVNDGWCSKSNYSTCNFGYNDRKNHPMNCVNWYGAKEYVNWLSVKTGENYRLPTEAEWEYAAKGQGKDVIYPWGNETATCEYAVMYGGDYGCGEGTWEVCSKQKGNTEQGLCDMAGNVWEWVEDWYDEKYYEKSPSSNPKGPSSGTYRVLRGGSWYGYSDNLRASNRDGLVPVNGLIDSDVGFRVARTE